MWADYVPVKLAQDTPGDGRPGFGSRRRAEAFVPAALFSQTFWRLPQRKRLVSQTFVSGAAVLWGGAESLSVLFTVRGPGRGASSQEAEDTIERKLHRKKKEKEKKNYIIKFL